MGMSRSQKHSEAYDLTTRRSSKAFIPQELGFATCFRLCFGVDTAVVWNAEPTTLPIGPAKYVLITVETLTGISAGEFF